MIVRVFIKEDTKDSEAGDPLSPQTGGGGHVSKEAKKLRKLIPVDQAVARWRKDPAYVKEYDALEEEFALVSAIIKARAAAGLTQQELAKRMKTTQGAIARLESGTTLPSTRTLKRFAKATGHKLKISFEPSSA
jgi:ribosome-binding protein aMBF1 (putative translation factor)